MNFDLEPELNQLDESLGRLLANIYSFDQRRAMVAGTSNPNPEVWEQLTKLGVTALGLPAELGGYDGGPIAHLPIMRAAGRTLWLEPYLSSVVLAGTALREAGSMAQKENWLSAIAAGRARLAWAHDEPRSPHKAAGTEARATCEGGTWQLHGIKPLVLHGASADRLMVSARISSAPEAEAETEAERALFLVDPKSAGVTLRTYRLIDDTPAADVTLSGARAELLGETDSPGAHAASAIAATTRAGMAAVCADMLGTMELAFELTRTYIVTRKQFGHAIAEYQAVRHRLADMAVSLELTRSMAFAAAAATEGEVTDETRSDLERAKIVIGRHSRSLCHSAIQLHGGIGMTNEYAVGHCLRRVHVLDHLFGDADAHLSRLVGVQLPSSKEDVHS